MLILYRLLGGMKASPRNGFRGKNCMECYLVVPSTSSIGGIKKVWPEKSSSLRTTKRAPYIICFSQITITVSTVQDN
jgi:hypothetical protein